MKALDDLQDLPLSHLFSGPLIAAIDASVQAQTESIALLRETGYEDGELATVTFEYTTRESDPETGRERRVAKRLELPVLLFLSLPNLEVSKIEEEFSAKITQVERSEDEPTSGRLPMPTRLNVRPTEQSTTFNRKSKAEFDLDVRLVAEIRNQSTGMDLLERTANTAVVERVDERKTARLAAEERKRTDGGSQPE